MEEAELLKERLQAITDKRRVQEDIAKKRTEIDEEKLKLHYLKKKELRDQWLQDGMSVPSSQDLEGRRAVQQQAKVLQMSIQRIEKEIEALERQEMVISKNEEFTLKRLRAIEKSSEDIIKEAMTDGKNEPVHRICSATPDNPEPHQIPNLTKQSTPALKMKDQPKKSLFAMEINVQKDLKTGESQVLSTTAITDREFQQKGIKVYDDGRKSVYAIGPEGQVLPNRVEELTPMEVQELLKKAKEKRTKTGLASHGPGFSHPCSRNLEQEQAAQSLCGLLEPHQMPPPELCYMQSEGESRPVVPNILRSSNGRPDAINGCNYLSNSFKTGSRVNGQNGRQSTSQEHREYYRMEDSTPRSRKSATAHSENSHMSAMDTMPNNQDSTEPVTMIFMGYQRLDDLGERNQLGSDCEDVIRAELVIIDDEDEENLEPQRLHQAHGKHAQNNPRAEFKAGTE
ncbi:hypothetical protein GJAV_G00112920 [Gymnothorax javanicus]|nr:hypothetical protein GJAV_G00112920 [Gymnothorax javanicus]